ncbi:hypothetical protein [Polaribacter vadi]|tara:strand:+ start:10298 stop:10438 length:141 start_codon:yes stop_codon:yes gene_type:complete
MKQGIEYKKDTFIVKVFGAKDEKNTTFIEMDVERPMIKQNEVIIKV